jgi:hypothetical protein
VGIDQETPKRAESLGKPAEENSARKRKQLPQSYENDDDSDDLDRNSNQPPTQAQAIDCHLGGTHELKDTPVDNSMTSQKEGLDSPSSSEGALRRSSRKKRKISNYSRLIDIGAATSEDERVL